MCPAYRSSITRIKDQNLFLRDISQERATLEASRESTSPKTKTSRAPSFSESESPKEDQEKEKFDDNVKKDASSSEESEESSEETSDESEEEAPKKPVANSLLLKAKPMTNSIHSTPKQNAKLESESEGSESETEESSSEEEPVTQPSRPGPRSTSRPTELVRTPQSRIQSTPAVTSGLRSPFLDSDKKGDTPTSPVSRSGAGRTFGTSREEKKEEAKSRFSNFPTRTTAASTSVSSNTTSNVGSRVSSTPSEDSHSRTTRAKRVTKRAGTAYVGGSNAKDGDEEEEEDNDKARKGQESRGIGVGVLLLFVPTFCSNKFIP